MHPHALMGICWHKGLISLKMQAFVGGRSLCSIEMLCRMSMPETQLLHIVSVPVRVCLQYLFFPVSLSL